MTKLAPVMLKNEPETEIAELDYFPAENLITASQKLYLINAFGFEQFSDVFTADYNINGQQITAFLGEKPNVQDAAASAKAYYDFLISMGAEAKSAEDNNLDIKILDTFGYVEIIFTIGDFVGGVHQAQNQEAAEQLAKELINKLSVCSKK
jgi:histidinol phosphatase-like PHP family hydrolase